MSKKNWTLVDDLESAAQTQVFSGGACNLLDEQGHLLRNDERDAINDWLTEQGIVFFDPQIHPDTHGCEYDYDVHFPVEMAARAAAKINLYEVSLRTFGGITSLEIAADQFRYREPMVIYFSDGTSQTDAVPAHSEKGYPLFVPHGINSSEAAMQAHYHEFIKNANNMRKYLVSFAKELDTLTVTFNDRVYEGDIAISPERMHAADIFRAVVHAASGQRVFVTFTGGDTAQDANGNPVLRLPQNPPKIQMQALLDQYVDEANALRRAMAELVRINVFTRVVYTHRSAIIALEEVLRIKQVIA
ncbi:MAG: hypothetical protein K8L99_26650 [Anaerolineae bacterium]|nr:hypothetical protein [Anaerolineae bacterium]